MALNEHYIEIHDRLLETVKELQHLLTQAEADAESSEDHFVRGSVFETLMQVNETIKNLQIYQKDVIEGVICEQADGLFQFCSPGVVRDLNPGHYIERYDESSDMWCCGRVSIQKYESRLPEFYFASDSACDGKLTTGMRVRIRVC